MVRRHIKDILGKLDCLRETIPPSTTETKEEKTLRTAANWDSDCSFESDSNGIKV